MKKELICFFVLILFLISGVDAATYWVSPTGTASWTNCQGEIPLSGTACCSLSTANNNVAAGDTIYLRGGTYYITDSGINPINSGVRGAPITYANYNNELVEFIGASSTSFAVNLNSDYGTIRNYIIVKGIIFKDFYRHLWILRGSHNEITNCMFKGLYSREDQGTAWRGSTIYRNAQYNHIHNNTFCCYGNFYNNYHNGVVFELGNEYADDDMTSYNLIEHNHFYHGGHHVFGWGGNKNVIRNNYFHNEDWWEHPETGDKYGYRVLMSAGLPPANQRNLFEGNRISFGGRSNSTQIGGSGGTIATSYNIIRGNVFDHTLLYGQLFRTYPGMISSYNKLYHNVFYHCGYKENQYEYMKPNYNREYSHALYFSVGNNDDEYTYTSIHNNSIKNNIFYDNRNILNSEKPIIRSSYGWTRFELKKQFIENNWEEAGDPEFLDVSGVPDPMNWKQFDFRLQSNSLCIDAGAFLTFIKSPNGYGTSFNVNDAGYFMDGWGIIDGDIIQLEGLTKKVMITSIDYETNTITVNESISWTQGQGVSLAYEGNAPDIGAYEYVSGEIIPDPITPTSDIVTLQDMLGAYQQYKRNEVSLLYFLDKLRRWIVFW